LAQEIPARFQLPVGFVQEFIKEGIGMRWEKWLRKFVEIGNWNLERGVSSLFFFIEYVLYGLQISSVQNMVFLN